MIRAETPQRQSAGAAQFLVRGRAPRAHDTTFGPERVVAVEGLETTQEKVVVVVVDTGRARPGVFWASIPYNSSELNAGMDQVYASLKVND